MTSSAIVQKLWNYCNILRDDGLPYGDYPSAESILSAAEGLRTGSEQLTYSVSLKMADEWIPLSSPVHSPTGVFRTSCGLSADWIIDIGEAKAPRKTSCQGTDSQAKVLPDRPMVEAATKYPNPPIQETICEAHFDLAEPLSLQRIELLKGVWSAGYPEQKVVQEKSVNFHLSPEGIQTKEGNLGHRLICKTADGQRLVQLSGLFFAANQLRPYPGWEEAFRGTILQRSQELQKTIGPLKFKRVGLRYINRIDVPQVPLVWEKWFQIKLSVPKLSGSKQREFQMQFHQELSGSRRFIINLATLGSPDGKVSPVILDLDLIWEGAPTDLGELGRVLEHVHGPHRLAFEAYLSDKVRKLFY